MGIIKSYSEYLRESFWGDVHKRSRGDVMRREDAVTYKDLQREDATMEQLYRYLTQHYTPIAKMEGENPINDITTREDQIEVGKKTIIIPLTTDGKLVEIEPVITNPDEILFVNAPSEFSKLIKNDGFFTRYRYGQPYFKGMSSFHREEKEIRKSDAVDLLDKLLAYVDNPILKKKSPLMESFWGDVHRRSRGDEIRKEDIIHYEDLKNVKCTLDILYQYLLQHYTVLGDDKITYDENKGIEIPVKLENEPITVIPTDHDTVFSIEAPFSLREYIEKSKYSQNSWDEDGCIEVIISEVSDDMCCGDVVNFLDEVLSLVPTPALKKSEHLVKESFWGDVHKRSIGDEIRKEDEIGNLRSLKPVDMGGSVLWADQNLIYDGDEIFTFEDANNLISDSGWRLPTRKEVAELDGHNIYYDTQYIYLDDDKKLSFKKCGCGYTPKTGKPFTLDENKAFYGWTSEPYQYNSNDIHVFILDHFELTYSPEKETINNQVTQNVGTKCGVRLVKDK
jgi:hypothetical protein